MEKKDQDSGAGLIHQVASPSAETEPRPNCSCENPYCGGRHVEPDRFWRIVRATLVDYREMTDPDHGDLVIAEEAIIAAARSAWSSIQVGSGNQPTKEQAASPHRSAAP